MLPFCWLTKAAESWMIPEQQKSSLAKHPESLQVDILLLYFSQLLMFCQTTYAHYDLPLSGIRQIQSFNKLLEYTVYASILPQQVNSRFPNVLHQCRPQLFNCLLVIILLQLFVQFPKLLYVAFFHLHSASFQ